ncbi:MAG: hypothetical protein ACYDDF_05380 [Thermoplasmatota archaeon]
MPDPTPSEIAHALGVRSWDARIWLALGHSLMVRKERGTTVSGRYVLAADAFARGLDLGATEPEAWLGVFFTLDEGAAVSIRTKTYGRREALAQYLATGPSTVDARFKSAMWLALRELTPSGARTLVGNQEYSRRDCAAKAIEADRTHPEAFFAMGNDLGNDSVVVAGVAYRGIDYYAAAIGLDPKASGAWNNAGTHLPPSLTMKMGSKSYMAQDCFLISLSIDAKNGLVWRNLSGTIPDGRSINADERLNILGYPSPGLGKALTRNECLARAAGISDADEDWTALGHALGRKHKIPVNGRVVSAKDCLTKVCERNPKNPKMAEAWNLLGWVLARDLRKNVEETATLWGNSWTAMQCHAQSLILDPKNSDAWDNLERHLRKGDQVFRVTIGAYQVTGERDYWTAWTKDHPTDAEGWYRLASTLGRGQSAEIGGSRVTDISALLMALELKQDFAEAWLALGLRLEPAEVVKVRAPKAAQVAPEPGGLARVFQRFKGSATPTPQAASVVEVGRTTCFARAAAASPTTPYMWTQLGLSLGSSGKFQNVDGRSGGPIDCLSRALELDPGASFTWASAALILQPNETVMFYGVPRDRAFCLDMARRCGE